MYVLLTYSLLHTLFDSFFFYESGPHRHLHSFPTRRSSDLATPPWAAGPRPRRGTASHARRRGAAPRRYLPRTLRDRKSTRLNSSHLGISYAVFCLKKKKKK